MESPFPNRTGRQDHAGGPADISGETRRLRLSEFHQNTRRAPNFYARANPIGSFPSPAFEATRRAPLPEPTRPVIQEPKRTPLWIFLLIAALILGIIAAAAAGYVLGAKRGRSAALREMDARAFTMTRLPEAEMERLNQAIADMRSGESGRAVDTFESLRKKLPQASSLNYLSALAALQAGRTSDAETFVKESLRLRQRISDCLALQAVLEKTKPDFSGEAKTRAEALLRAAITADSANPSPHFELAMMLRTSNRREEARREFHAARSRLHPIDSLAAIETILALMALEEAKDSALPKTPPNSSTLAEGLSAAYIAMRRGNYPEAAAALAASQAMAGENMFDFLINDPVFSAYRLEKEIAPFYR